MNYKGYLITPTKGLGSAYEIATAGQGGKIPNIMNGLFTSRGTAMQVIDSYLESKESEVKSNDKKVDKG